MFWYLLQGLIVFAVVASNIHWHWTPNGYLASAIGAGLALVATLLDQRHRDVKGPKWSD
jgi:hypothetical protein